MVPKPWASEGKVNEFSSDFTWNTNSEHEPGSNELQCSTDLETKSLFHLNTSGLKGTSSCLHLRMLWPIIVSQVLIRSSAPRLGSPQLSHLLFIVSFRYLGIRRQGSTPK